MARIVFGWEFGASLGHIYPLLRVADALKEKGHDILFVCRDVDRSFDVVKSRGYPMIQAPFWKNLPIPNVRSIATPSYADVLARQGFAYRKTVQHMVSAWDDLLRILKPDLIIADHSPGLNIAVRRAIPMINIGNGFTLPPTEIDMYPPILATGKRLVAQDMLMKQFNELHLERGRQPYVRLPQIFDTEGQFACTLPHLDPYVDVRVSPVCGPLEDCMETAPPPEAPHVFMYMANEAEDSELALEAVQKLGCQASVYIRGASEERRQKYTSRHMTMLDKPADFSDSIPKASLVIHSGGSGTATSCLMTGRPQIMFPRQSEALMSGRLLASQGLAHSIGKGTGLGDLTHLLKQALGDQAMQDRCYQAALEIAQGDWKNALEKVTDRATELLS